MDSEIIVAKRVNIQIWLLLLTVVNFAFTLQDFAHADRFTTTAWVMQVIRLLLNIIGAVILKISYAMDLQTGTDSFAIEARSIVWVLVINHLLLVMPSTGLGYYYLLSDGNFYEKLPQRNLSPILSLYLISKVFFIFINMLMIFIALKSIK